MTKIVLITNGPAPYRIPAYNIIADKYGDGFTVIYCSHREPDRDWDLPEISHACLFLKENIIKKNGNFIHNNPDVYKHLSRISPDIVITIGFNPTFIYGFFWSLLHGRKHICMTDGTLFSESFLTWKHRLIRKFVFKFSSNFIGASEGSRKLFVSYGIPEKKIFKSPLCVDNEKFGKYAGNKKEYDVMFSGRFIERKMPFFFIDVVKKLKERMGNIRVLLIGSGPLKDEILRELDRYGINFFCPGSVPQGDLPRFYSSSKLLLFPTQNDAWGVVANEALASGVPVITCQNAGVADELIINGVNGFVLPLIIDKWAEKIDLLLNNRDLYAGMSEAAIEKVREYNFKASAEGIIMACEELSGFHR